MRIRALHSGTDDYKLSVLFTAEAGGATTVYLLKDFYDDENEESRGSLFTLQHSEPSLSPDVYFLGPGNVVNLYDYLQIKLMRTDLVNAGTNCFWIDETPVNFSDFSAVQVETSSYDLLEPEELTYETVATQNATYTKSESAIPDTVLDSWRIWNVCNYDLEQRSLSPDAITFSGPPVPLSLEYLFDG